MEKIEQKDFLSFKYLSNINTSNGTTAFVVSQADEDKDGYSSNIFLAKNGKVKQWSGLDKESSFTWYHDQLLFSGIRSEKDKKATEKFKAITHFYQLAADGGEALKCFTIPLKVSHIKYWTDDYFLVVATVDLNYPDWHTMSEEQREEAVKKQQSESGYEVIDELSWWSNGRGFVNKTRSGLFLFNAKDESLTRISEPTFNVHDIEIHNDKKRVLYYGINMIDTPVFDTTVYEYSLADKTSKIIYDEAETVRLARYYQDGLLLVKTDRKAYGMNENASFYYLDGKGDVSLLCAHDGNIGSSVGTDCRYGGSSVVKMVDDKLYFITTVENRSVLKVLADGQLTTLIDKEGSIDGFDIDGDNIDYIAFHDMKLQEVYRYNLVTKETIQLTTLNEANLSNKYVATPEKLRVDATETYVDGWVLKPYQYDENKTYPAILDIHGGPKTVYGEIYYHEMQYWASKGYFVFFCNPKGSDGRGNEFMDIRGKYGTIDYQHIMEFTDAVLAKYPQIDQKRVGVTGGSYGGFMTNWIIGHTDRFVAAATQRSISNWISFVGTSDIGTYFGKDQNKVDDLYTDFDKLWEHSPLKYIKNAKTPTLVIHSSEDYRCWLPEGFQLYTALKYQGVDTRMVYFKGENHELSRSGKPSNRIKRLAEITAWMDKYTGQAN